MKKKKERKWSTKDNNNKIPCRFNNLKFLLTMNTNTNKIMKYGVN